VAARAAAALAAEAAAAAKAAAAAAEEEAGGEGGEGGGGGAGKRGGGGKDHGPAVDDGIMQAGQNGPTHISTTDWHAIALIVPSSSQVILMPPPPSGRTRPAWRAQPLMTHDSTLWLNVLVHVSCQSATPLQWAHLASLADSVDPIWGKVSTWLRDKWVQCDDCE
jgi:hypothetical protein